MSRGSFASLREIKVTLLIETGGKRKTINKISKCGIGPVDKADMLVSFSSQIFLKRKLKIGSVILFSLRF